MITPSAPALFCDTGSIHRQGEAGIIELRLEIGSEPVQSVDVGLTCGLCGLPGEKRRRIEGDLVAGAKRELRFQWKPLEPGWIAVDLLMVVEFPDGELAVFECQVPFVVLPASAPQRPANINIDIHDIDRIMGVDMSRLASMGLPTSESANSVLAPRVPTWQPVQLEYNTSRSLVLNSQRRRLVGEQDDSIPRRGSAFLDVCDSAGSRTIQVVASNRLRIGRSVSANDLAIRFLPDTDANVDRSRGISRQQFVVEDGGDRMVLRSVSPSTWVGDKLLGSDDPLSVESPVKVTAGLCGLELLITPFMVRSQAPPDVTLRWLASLNRAEESRPTQLACARVRRLNNAPEREACWILREARIGSDSDLAIVVSGLGVASLHARLLQSGGRYYLERLAETHGTWVDGQPLASGDVCALGSSHELKFGTVTARWRLTARQG